MQLITNDRARQIAFPQRQAVSRTSFSSKPVARFSPAPSRSASRFGIAPKLFLVNPGMAVPNRSAARPKHRDLVRSAAQIRQRESTARVIAIDLRRPVEATGKSFTRFDQQRVQGLGSLNALRPMTRLGQLVLGWLRPSY